MKLFYVVFTSLTLGSSLGLLKSDRKLKIGVLLSHNASATILPTNIAASVAEHFPNIKLETDFMTHAELYKLHQPHRGYDVLLEGQACSAATEIECYEFRMMASELPNLSVIANCCFRQQKSPIYGTPIGRNLIFNTLNPTEMAYFIVSLSDKYGWKNFGFLISPQLDGANEFFLEVNQTVSAITHVRNYAGANQFDDNGDEDDDVTKFSITLNKFFYSSEFEQRYGLAYSFSNVIATKGIAFFLILDERTDLAPALEKFRHLSSDLLMVEGTALFLIQWSPMTLGPLSANQHLALPGLMILRQTFMPPSKTAEEQLFKNGHLLKRNQRHALYHSLFSLAAMANETLDKGRQVSHMFCNSTFSSEAIVAIRFDETCQRRTSTFEILNIQLNSTTGNYDAVVIFEFQPDLKPSNVNSSFTHLLRHVDDEKAIVWFGSGATIPTDSDYCGLEFCSNRKKQSKIDGSVVGGGSGGGLVSLLIVSSILFFAIRALRRHGQSKQTIKDQVIIRYTELNFFDEEDQQNDHKQNSGGGSVHNNERTSKVDRSTPMGRLSMSSNGELPRTATSETNPTLGAVNSAATIHPYRSNHLASIVTTVGRFGLLAGAPGDDDDGDGQKMAVALFRGEKVFVRHLPKIDCVVDAMVIQEILEIHQLQHVNINNLIGVTTEPHRICTIQPYCSKGTLAQVLFERKVQLDRIFKLSFANDIAAGLAFLHQSSIESHGRLSVDNILVDSRWFCRIGNIPLPRFENSGIAMDPLSPTMAPYHITLQDADGAGAGDDEEAVSSDGADDLAAMQEDAISYPPSSLIRKFGFKVTTAPELLRIFDPPMRGTRKADIYSFGIVLAEIITRKRAYHTYGLPLNVILRKVAEGCYPTFRPLVNCHSNLNDLAQLFRICTDEIPAFRPDAASLVNMLRKLNNGKENNLVDCMVATMEQYAVNLEDMVAERTVQLNEEKKRSEELLLKMLPRAVLEELKNGRSVNPESYESVTVSFLDVVGFTKMASESSPIEIVEFLNDMYTAFDTIIDGYDVYKVETIGDSYMVASGLPKRNQNRHAGEIATMALDIMSCVASFKIRHRPGKQLQLRCGMHSGPAVAGIVGLKMPRYCLFGDTVNYASRMESSCLALRIHVSPESKAILDSLGGYILSERGFVAMKGKGEILTYYLQGKAGFNKPMPDLSLAASWEEHEFK